MSGAGTDLTDAISAPFPAPIRRKRKTSEPEYWSFGPPDLQYPGWKICMSSITQETFVTKEQVLPEDQPSRGAASRVNPERSLELAKAAVRTAAENGGTNIVLLDLTEQTAMFDYFVIATGTSRRQLHAMSEEIDHKLEDDLNDKRMNIDGYDESRWIVLDYGTVLIHLFDEETRDFYSLEALWGDSKNVDVSEILADIK